MNNYTILIAEPTGKLSGQILNKEFWFKRRSQIKTHQEEGIRQVENYRMVQYNHYE